MAKVFTLIPQYELRKIAKTFSRVLYRLDLSEMPLSSDIVKRAVNKTMWSS
jgi:hypothetical protein